MLLPERGFIKFFTYSRENEPINPRVIPYRLLDKKLFDCSDETVKIVSDKQKDYLRKNFSIFSWNYQPDKTNYCSESLTEPGKYIDNDGARIGFFTTFEQALRYQRQYVVTLAVPMFIKYKHLIEAHSVGELCRKIQRKFYFVSDVNVFRSGRLEYTLSPTSRYGKGKSTYHGFKVKKHHYRSKELKNRQDNYQSFCGQTNPIFL